MTILVTLRREYAAAITSGSQALLLAVGLEARSRTVWMLVVAAIGAISLVAWASARARHRAFADTPTSRIASAAQGYVELQGRGVAFEGLQVLSPLTGLPCLWYRHRVEERDDRNRWRTVSVDESDASLVIEDGSGRCLVDIEGAEILTRHRDTRRLGARRDTVWTLLIGDTLQTLGTFRTLGSQDHALDVRRDTAALLAEWKRDRGRLLERFDTDRDGTLSMAEWEAARRAALREVTTTHRDLRAGAELHTLARPADGRLFLISNLDPAALARRYRIWSWVHLALFFGALALLPSLWHAHA